MRRERRERVHGPYKHRRRWRVIVTGADGSQVTESFETEAEAERVAAAARAQSEGRTLTHAVDAYEVSLRERELAGETVTRARRHLEKLLQLEKNGGRALTWLTPKRAEKLYADTRASSAVDTHRNALAAGRSLGRFAAKRGWLPGDPFADVEAVGRRKRGKPQLSIDETRKLVDKCVAENSRESLAVAACVLLGCGASEIAHRKVRDLDDCGRVLHVTKGKNEYRVRSLEVPDDLRPLLRALAGDRPGAAYLFGDADLARPTRYWVYWHCGRLCRLAKVPEVSPHGLRGTHSTIALGAVSTSHSVVAALAAAGAALGHAPGSPITASTYVAPGAVDRARQRAAMRVISGDARVTRGEGSAEKASAIGGTRTPTVLPTGT
jgi:integrase